MKSRLSERSLLLVGFILVVLTACKEQPVYTESMLKMDKAKREQQAIIDRANDVISRKVGDSPVVNLAQLAYAKELSLSAQDVFDKAKIVGVEQASLRALEQRIEHYQPALAGHAISLLKQATDRSDAFREKLDEIDALPFIGATQTSGEDMAGYLRELYNEDIQNCCLETLARIEPMLQNASISEYLAIRRLILNVKTQQAFIARNADKSLTYRSELERLQDQLDKQ